MGGWQQEVFRMAIYLSVPVGMYLYANLSSVNERWRKNWRQTVYDSTGVSNFEFIVIQ